MSLWTPTGAEEGNVAFARPVMNEMHVMTDEDDIRQILKECCVVSGPTKLIFPSLSSEPEQAFFSEIDDRGVSFQVQMTRHEAELRLMTICCVSFPYENQSCAFLGSLVQHRSVRPATIELVVDIPSQITTLNARKTFRVPVATEMPLHLNVPLTDGKSLHPRVINVSMTGVLVEFRKDDDPNWITGMRVPLEFRFDRTETLKVVGLVRRRQYHRYGLVFPDVTQRGFCTSEPLRRMVKSLERNWLQNRPRE